MLYLFSFVKATTENLKQVVRILECLSVKLSFFLRPFEFLHEIADTIMSKITTKILGHKYFLDHKTALAAALDFKLQALAFMLSNKLPREYLGT